jgi:hypothetical protein
MCTGVEESAQVSTSVDDSIGIGDAYAVETQRACFAGERGLQLMAAELDGGVQKSRST